jgi:HJR/Mrr/RecB family endonuclease
VTVKTVREVLGAKADDHASKALIVTTTDFTADAKALINRHRWCLEGKAYDDIVAWVSEYNRMKGIVPPSGRHNRALQASLARRR